MALNFCVAKLVCESEAEKFSRTLSSKNSSDAEADQAYEQMTSCVSRFAQDGHALFD